MMRNWPLFQLRIVTPRLTLVVPTDAQLDDLADLAARGVHAPDWMPFSVPWTRHPIPDLQRGLLQWHWRQRADWRPDRWELPLVAIHEGGVVGTQAVGAEDFAIRRDVLTGSWLGSEYQGRGLGKEMRAAVLHLAFAGLGALTAQTEAFIDNKASIGVTRSLGYSSNGQRVLTREGRRAVQAWFVMDRDSWAKGRRSDIRIEGLEACRELFGVAEGPSAG